MKTCFNRRYYQSTPLTPPDHAWRAFVVSDDGSRQELKMVGENTFQLVDDDGNTEILPIVEVLYHWGAQEITLENENQKEAFCLSMNEALRANDERRAREQKQKSILKKTLCGVIIGVSGAVVLAGGALLTMYMLQQEKLKAQKGALGTVHDKLVFANEKLADFLARRG